MQTYKHTIKAKSPKIYSQNQWGQQNQWSQCLSKKFKETTTIIYREITMSILLIILNTTNQIQQWFVARVR
jgi:hypothetical protein